MIIDFDEILDDLEVKRASLIPAGELPLLSVDSALEPLAAEGVALRVLDELGDERPFDLREPSTWVAEALSTLAAARDRELDEPAGERLVRDVALAVSARLRLLPGATITAADLSAVVEAALIELDAFDVAKALVMRRSGAAVAGLPAADEPRVIRRSGHVVAWNGRKIESAIRKAFLSLRIDPEPAARLAERVGARTRSLGLAYVPIETIQDLVQEELVLSGNMRVAERYILYRAERAMLRAEGRLETDAAPTLVELAVVEPDGSRCAWGGADLRARIRFASIGLDLPLTEAELELELRRSVSDGILRADLDRLVVLNAKSLIERDADSRCSPAASSSPYIYEETLGWDIVRDGIGALEGFHQRALRPDLEPRRCDQPPRPARSRVRPRPARRRPRPVRRPRVRLPRHPDALRPLPDHRQDRQAAAPPRDAAALLAARRDGPLPRRDRTTARAHARSLRALQEPPLLLVHADALQLRHAPLAALLLLPLLRRRLARVIMERGIAENAFSKWAGGLGGSWTAVRGTGAHIQGTNGETQGVIPFLKLHNDQLVAVNQGGKRKGSGCAYLETWHNDIYEFLELRKNTGDDRRRTHDMNTANWIPDLFMKRMEAAATWTLFRANECPTCTSSTAGRSRSATSRTSSSSRGQDLRRSRSTRSSSGSRCSRCSSRPAIPWITFKDACNVRSPQDHVGVIHSSNLCTEITLNTSTTRPPSATSAPSSSTQHLQPTASSTTRSSARRSAIAVRALDNVIDINFYPTEAAARRRTCATARSASASWACSTRSTAAASPSPRRGRRVQRRGPWRPSPSTPTRRPATSPPSAARYSSYKGSKWDRGLLPQDTLDLLEQERGVPIEVPRGGEPGLGAPARQDREARHAQQQRPRHRADRDDLEHHGHLALHRADLQEPLREIQPLRRVHRPESVPREGPQGPRPLDAGHDRHT